MGSASGEEALGFIRAAPNQGTNALSPMERQDTSVTAT